MIRPNDRPARLHHRHHRRRPAWAGCWRMAAAQLGYRCHVYAPDADSAAGRGRRRIHAGRVRRRGARSPRFAAEVDVATYEFENIPTGAARRARRHGAAPSAASTRWRSPRTGSSEKAFVQRHGGRPGAVRARSTTEPGSTPRSPRSARPAILKTRRFGYDGKGQVRIDAPGEADARLGRRCAARPACSKALVRVRRRILDPALPRRATARSCPGTAPRNRHEGGILVASTRARRRGSRRRRSPRREALARARRRRARPCRRAGDGVFRARRRGRCSTRWRRASTIAATGRSRARAPRSSRTMSARSAACRWARPTSPRRASRCAIWSATRRTAGAEILADPAAHLHLYGKGEARPGRKMGHVTRLLDK